MIQVRLRLLGPISAALLLLTWRVSAVIALDQCPADQTYSSTPELQTGTVSGSAYVSEGAVRLSPPAALQPYVNVACSGRGTVARINVNTGQVVGEYRTAPETTASPDPSRTTVDHNGSTWVANRYINESESPQRGSIARIGFIAGENLQRYRLEGAQYIADATWGRTIAPEGFVARGSVSDRSCRCVAGFLARCHL